jgi:predicted metal-binding protein
MSTFYGSIDLGSDILDDNMKQILLEMILAEQCGGCVAGSRVPMQGDRLCAEAVDAAVHTSSHFLIIIETITGSIFGAVAHSFLPVPAMSSVSSAWTTLHQHNFLFSLCGPGSRMGERGPTIPLKLGASEPKLHVHLSNCGFHMGTDLVALCSKPVCMPNQYCSVDASYGLPLGKSLVNGTLCGSPGTASYTALKTEVFSLVISSQ